MAGPGLISRAFVTAGAVGVLILVSGSVAAARAPATELDGPTAAGNLAAAKADASTLLSALGMPSGAVKVAAEPAGDGGALAGPPFTIPTPNLVDDHAFWVVPGEASSLVAYLKEHPPAGSRYSLFQVQAQGPNGTFGAESVGFDWPAIAGVLGQRELIVSFAGLSGGGTGVRADAMDIWITPRPGWEQIPSGARTMSIVATGNNGRRTTPVVVHSPSRIRQLVGLINSLPVGQPGVYHCAVSFGPTFVVRFFAAGSSSPLAQVATDQACNAVGFRLGSSVGPALNGAYELVEAINRIAAIPDCIASQLHPDGQSLGAGQATFTFISTSRKMCLLTGYPRLTIRDEQGSRLPVKAVDMRLPVASRPPVDMTPGSAATFLATLPGPEHACSHPVASVQVALPGRRTGSLTIPLPRRPHLYWPCRGRITLQPFWPQR